MGNQINYSSEAQSKKLLELGLTVDSADMYWEYDNLQKFHRISIFEDGFAKHSQMRENDIPAWSVKALLDYIGRISSYNTFHYGDVEVYVSRTGSVVLLDGKFEYVDCFEDHDNDAIANLIDCIEHLKTSDNVKWIPNKQ